MHQISFTLLWSSKTCATVFWRLNKHHIISYMRYQNQIWVNSLPWKLFNHKMPELSPQLLFSKGKRFKEHSTQKFIWTSILVGIFFFSIRCICFACGCGHVVLTIRFIFHPSPPTTDILCDSCAKCSTENGKLQIIKLCCLWSSLVNLLCFKSSREED